jgi:hypothetical protein
LDLAIGVLLHHGASARSCGLAKRIDRLGLLSIIGVDFFQAKVILGIWLR